MAIVSLAYLTVLLAPVLPQEFKAGRLHALDSSPFPANDRIVEFDETGAIVRSVDAGTNFSLGLAFGPNGHAFVGDGTNDAQAQTGRVIEVDGQGNIVNTFFVGQGEQPRTVVFGADGRILVNVNDSVAEHSLLGVEKRVYSQKFGKRPFVGLAGHVFVPFPEFGAEVGAVNEFDSSAISIRTFGDPQIIDDTLSNLEGLWRPTDASTLIFHDAKFFAFDANGVKTAEKNLAFFDDQPPVIGPDGLIYAGGNTVKRATLEGVSVNTLTTAIPAFSLAFAPFRFKANVNGTMVTASGELLKVKETAIVSVHPAAGRMDIQWIDNVFAANDMASLFGTTAWVFHGLERASTGPKPVRHFHGSQVSDPQASAGLASIGADVRGKVSESGVFTPTKVIATLHRSNTAGVFTGRVVTSKRLN